MMYDFGMMGSGNVFGMGLLWIFNVALAAFVFGIVFWWTKKLVFGKK